MSEMIKCDCGKELKWSSRFPNEKLRFSWYDDIVEGTIYFYDCDCGNKYDRKHHYSNTENCKLELDFSYAVTSHGLPPCKNVSLEIKSERIPEPKALKGLSINNEPPPPKRFVKEPEAIKTNELSFNDCDGIFYIVLISMLFLLMILTELLK